ncbi:hypothetical protein [Halpernia sp.]|uniref:hypothetical protein n=1 Tax=Halpernia sp. TaxID=2782209 RepID=UPI003A913607
MSFGQGNAVITVSTSTYQQMVNSGSMRYLENQKLKDSIATYNDLVNNLINYNDRILNTEDNNFIDVGKLIDVHDFFRSDKIRSGEDYQPKMDSFTLNDEQRRYLISYFKIFSVQSTTNHISVK